MLDRDGGYQLDGRAGYPKREDGMNVTEGLITLVVGLLALVLASKNAGLPPWSNNGR